MRATFSFGFAGGALAILALLTPAAIVFFFPLAGVVASLLLHQGSESIRKGIVAGAHAAVGFGFTGMMVMFSAISLQADVEPLWGALAWGIGFGVAGVISGQSLSQIWHPDSHGSNAKAFAELIAGVAFSISGAVAGFMAFQQFPKWSLASLSLGIWLAFQLGGVGCDLGRHLGLKQRNPNEA
jgi:hypothetical protein